LLRPSVFSGTALVVYEPVCNLITFDFFALLIDRRNYGKKEERMCWYCIAFDISVPPQAFTDGTRDSRMKLLSLFIRQRGNHIMGRTFYIYFAAWDL
jgi:hypothetical protein